MEYSNYFKPYAKLTSEVGKTVSVIDYDRFEEFFEALSADMSVPETLKVAVGLMCTGGHRSSETLNVKAEDMYYRSNALFGRSIVLKKKHVIPYRAVMELILKKLKRRGEKVTKINRYQTIYQEWLRFNKKNEKSVIKCELGKNFESKLELFQKTQRSPSRAKVIMKVIKRCHDTNKEKLRQRYLPRRDFIVHGSIRAIIEKRLKNTRPNKRLVNESRFQILRLIKRYFGEDVTAHSMRHSFVSYLLFKLKKTTAEVAQITGMTEDNVKNYAKYKLVDELMVIYSKV